MNIREIISDDLKSMIDKGLDVLIIDILGEKSYESLHLPGAVAIEPNEDFVAEVKKLTAGDTDKTIVVYGANFNHNISTIKTQELMEAGFENVYDFKGGLKDWAAELYPLEGIRAPKK